jgi:hypothetical protein
MGKGIALQFKNSFPEMFEDYKMKSKKGEVKLGELYLWDDLQRAWPGSKNPLSVDEWTDL